MTAARTRAFHLPGAPPVEPAVGATLAVLAAGVGARSVVSIGSGGGLAGLWLLRGMRADGVLTALDGDAEQLRAARKAFAEAGIAPNRARLIFGTPGEVLPRLSPGAYDMVVCAGPPKEYSGHLAELLGLVRVGGTLVCHGLLQDGRVADRTARDPQTVAWRESPARSARTRRCCRRPAVRRRPAGGQQTHLSQGALRRSRGRPCRARSRRRRSRGSAPCPRRCRRRSAPTAGRRRSCPGSPAARRRPRR